MLAEWFYYFSKMDVYVRVCVRNDNERVGWSERGVRLETREPFVEIRNIKTHDV